MGHEDDEMRAKLSEQMHGMSSAMMDSMAPAMAQVAFLTDESKAYDAYVAALLPIALACDGTTNGGQEHIEAAAVEGAKRLLEARRQIYNIDTAGDRIRSVMPGAANLCNKPILRNSGEDTGHRCTRNGGHDGTCI